jgi:TolB protein
LLVLVATEKSAKAAFPGQNGKIVFQRAASNSDTNTEIYMMDPDGANQTNLINNPAPDYDPTVSADGAKIAFESGRDGNMEIYAMNADGTNQTRLTNDPTSDFAPAWSPDGTKIAFVSTRASTTTIANGDIYVINANGSGQTSVTSGSENDNLPSWQPLPPTAYDFSGFFSPVDNPEVATNKAKAGSAIPVKFSLGGDFGPNMFADGYPKFQQSACDSSDPSDAIEQTLSDASSHLNYDATTDQYTYVWKTNKDWAKNNTCGTLIVKLADDTEHLANFEFTK